MQKTIVVDKEEGETPLEALARARASHGIDPSVPMTYAGRLDPMASGKLLLLVGEECKRQREYHGLDKTYRFEVLFGFSTDTGDILGMPTVSNAPFPTESAVRALVSSLPGPITLPYPRFSSKTVSGKPLFLWTLEGKLGEIEIPMANTRIHTLRFLGTRRIPYATLLPDMRRRIALPKVVTEASKELGEDFRRNDIVPAWERILSGQGEAMVASFEAVVSSGTYIRALAPYMAEKLGTTGLAYLIHRTAIGRFLSFDRSGWGFWRSRYR